MYNPRATCNQHRSLIQCLHVGIICYGCDSIGFIQFFDILYLEKYGTLHEFACHPCAGAMLIFSVSFQFQYMYCRSKYNTVMNSLLIYTLTDTGFFLAVSKLRTVHVQSSHIRHTKLTQVQHTWPYCQHAQRVTFRTYRWPVHCMN